LTNPLPGKKTRQRRSPGTTTRGMSQEQAGKLHCRASSGDTEKSAKNARGKSRWVNGPARKQETLPCDKNSANAKGSSEGGLENRSRKTEKTDKKMQLRLPLTDAQDLDRKGLKSGYRVPDCPLTIQRGQAADTSKSCTWGRHPIAPFASEIRTPLQNGLKWKYDTAGNQRRGNVDPRCKERTTLLPQVNSQCPKVEFLERHGGAEGTQTPNERRSKEVPKKEGEQGVSVCGGVPY